MKKGPARIITGGTEREEGGSYLQGGGFGRCSVKCSTAPRRDQGGTEGDGEAFWAPSAR